MKSIRFLLLLIVAITWPFPDLNAQTALAPNIVGQWRFTYRGEARPYQFNENQTYTGRYPLSNKGFTGTWKLEGGKVLLFRQGKPDVFGSITFRTTDETEYVAEGYKMTGHRAKL